MKLIVIEMQMIHLVDINISNTDIHTLASQPSHPPETQFPQAKRRLKSPPP